MVPVIDHKTFEVDESERKRTNESAKYQSQRDRNPVFKYFSTSSDYHGLRLFPRKDVDPHLNAQSVGQLLYGFFEFWAHFDYDAHQVSLHSLGMAKKQRWQFRQQGKGQLTFVIQDPVDTKHNVSKNVRPHTAEVLINEFKRAQLMLLYGGKWMEDVCSGSGGMCYNGEDVHRQISSFREQGGVQGKKRRYVDEYIVSKYNLKLGGGGGGERGRGRGRQDRQRPHTPRASTRRQRKKFPNLRRRKSSI